MNNPLLLACLALSLSGCLAPVYERPALPQPVPEAYREEEGWKTAVPGDRLVSAWWTLFDDPALTRLVEEAGRANQNIAMAAANLRQARAAVLSAGSSLLPSASTGASATRGSGRSSYGFQVAAQWELSLWNHIPTLEMARAEAEATAADYAAVRLAVQAETAQNYFQLRTVDTQLELYDATLEAYEKALQLTQSQYRGGIVTLGDVSQAEAQLAAAQAQREELALERKQLVHALAILTGRLPSGFSLVPGGLEGRVPAVPRMVPSALLERRPDIAAAEREVAAANQQIGIARAAWFPTLSLGLERVSEGAWLSAPVHVWSMGPSAALSLFEGGSRIAGLRSARAAYEGTVAAYRQTVLEAFRDVEDALAALASLERQAEAQDRAVAASGTALRVAASQYREGMTTYLQVVSAQTTDLTNRRNAIAVRGRQLTATVDLIKALGGGWEATEMNALARGHVAP